MVMMMMNRGEEYKRDKMKVNNETAVFLEGFKGGSQLDLFFQFTYQPSFSSVRFYIIFPFPPTYIRYINNKK